MAWHSLLHGRMKLNYMYLKQNGLALLVTDPHPANFTRLKINPFARSPLYTARSLKKSCNLKLILDEGCNNFHWWKRYKILAS